jgi:hypothetical protein
LNKTFNEFHQLHSDLTNEGYINLPYLPDKTFIQVTNERKLSQRKIELEKYLQGIIKNKELRNSRELVMFLELNTFCPQFLVNCPYLVYKKTEPNNYYVRLVKYVDKANIFITVSNNKKNNKSNIKIFSFKNSSSVEDSYRLKKDRALSDQRDKAKGAKSLGAIVK